MFYRRHVKYDYNASLGTYRKRRYRRRWLGYFVVALGSAALLWYQSPAVRDAIDAAARFGGDREPIELELAVQDATQDARPASSTRLPFEPRVPVDTTSQIGAGDTALEASYSWINATVSAGDSLSLIFSRLGLSKRDLHEILQSGQDAKSLKRIKPGQSLRLRVDESSVLEMIYEFDYRRSLHVTRDNDHFASRIIESEPEIRTASAVAEITNSLFIAGQRAGLSDQLIMQLTDIFGWDIDFALDIRAGDHFSVIYEEIYKDGNKIKDGTIYAAEFFNRNRRLRAVRYVTDQGTSGYYSDSGKAMRKAFLRTPVNFSRISSRFNLRRRHPVLNRIRAHRGVDYAAPHGTPVRSTADGKVVFVGDKGGYGRTVVIQHGQVYSTLYAHLSRFARSAKHGRSIKQGQTIGYVGQTGLATGYHLHYEFLVNGVHRNPLTVKLPSAAPIEQRYLADFKAQSAPLLAELDALAEKRQQQDTLVAQVEADYLSIPELPASRPLDQRN